MAFLDQVAANLVYIEAAIAFVAAVIAERLIARYLKRISKRREWPPHITNGLVLFFRILILFGAADVVVGIVGVSSNLLVAFSALLGAAIGFASQRTLGNFIAGLFMFVTHPFRVSDYVKVDDVEGVVEEITFNYTKIRTQGNALVFISNLKVLDQNIVNYRYVSGRSRLYCYSASLSFDYVLSAKDLESVFDKVIEKYAKELPRKPEYVMQRITALERIYTFLLYVKDPYEIFTIQPSFVREITEGWEKAKAHK